MNGLICIDKPCGITSFDVIFKLRKIFKTKKIGHSGTLDPLASGVLPVFVNRATKVISYLENTDKSYVAEFLIGKKTDTQDITGTVLKESNSNVSKSDVDNILKKYIGEIEQIPPMFSAVKVNGVALYKLARQGKIVERKSRKVLIHELVCSEFDDVSQTGKLKITCSSGTYIRTLCDDIGSELSVGGVMVNLRRVMACGFEIKDCFSLDEILKISSESALYEKLIKIEDILKNFEDIEIDEVLQKKFLNGAVIKSNILLEKEGLFKVYGPTSFLGIGFVKNCILKPEKQLLEGNV